MGACVNYHLETYSVAIMAQYCPYKIERLASDFALSTLNPVSTSASSDGHVDQSIAVNAGPGRIRADTCVYGSGE